jgi:DNA-binding response OmpR family regulator
MILLVERSGNKEETFAASLERKGFRVEVVPTGRIALEQSTTIPPALIVLNAPSLGTSGLRMVKSLRDRHPDLPIIHILSDGTAPGDYPPGLADVTLSNPFTSRKLINRIKRLLPDERKDKDALEVGPIRFISGVRIVQANGREKRLTPKAASLLEVFLKHPEETLDRAFLMRQVWDTDYIGDTRTLDVHVRWVREAIEPEPGKPCHILTVRGVGYRFEPEATPDKDP